jgi:hypothetical protein
VASVWPTCAMLQQSGPVNTPCSGWHLKILWPAFRRLEIPQTTRSSSATTIGAPHLVAEPRARNRIFAARDKAAKSAVLPPQRPVGAYHTSHDARKCGLFSRSLREREVPRVRGGPERTQTACQARSPIEPVSVPNAPGFGGLCECKPALESNISAAAAAKWEPQSRSAGM